MKSADSRRKWWLDTTSCCRSANNSGIQRVVRGIYRHLSDLRSVQPLVWDEFLGKYATPTSGEQQFLVAPFQHASQPSTNPNRQGGSFAGFLNKRIQHCVGHWNAESGDPRDLLLLPEVFRDSRLLYMPRPQEIPMPVVAWFHDACALQLGPMVPSAKTRRFERYLRYLAECDQIVTISRYSALVFRQWCAKEQLSSPPVHVLPLPVEFPGMRTTQSREPDNPRVQVLFVSSLTYNKNHLGLFNACQVLWDRGIEFDLVLVGKVDTAWKPHILPHLQELQQKGYPIIWHRHVSDETLQECYRNCHFTVYPSLCEGYGLPILESLWFGKPCLLPDSGAMREVATSGGCQFFSFNQPDSLVRTLEKLITSPQLRQTLAQEACQSRFPQWSEYRDQLISILDRVTKR